jgi:hypothetical protein
VTGKIPVLPSNKQLAFQPMAAMDGPIAILNCLLNDVKNRLAAINP